MILNNIDTKKHYEYVLGDLPVAKDLPKPDMLSTSVMLSRGVLSLPIYPELTDNEVEYIADKVDEFFGE
jgi:dTDP-4-amino-4,6-dideoxygalactose transaminase